MPPQNDISETQEVEEEILYLEQEINKNKIMKRRIVLALTFVFATTFIGCSSDDNGTSTASIVGKWRTEKFDYYIDGQFEETDITVEENESCPDNIEFKSNGTYVVLDYDAACTATAEDSGTYDFNGTTVTYGAEGMLDTGTVIQLTATEMIVDFTETSSQGVEFKNVGYFKRMD